MSFKIANDRQKQKEKGLKGWVGVFDEIFDNFCNKDGDF